MMYIIVSALYMALVPSWPHNMLHITCTVPAIRPLDHSGIALSSLHPILVDTLSPSYGVLYLQLKSSTAIFVECLSIILDLILIIGGVKWSEGGREGEGEKVRGR